VSKVTLQHATKAFCFRAVRVSVIIYEKFVNTMLQTACWNFHIFTT